MANAFLVVFLVAVAGGALAARPNAVHKLSCQNRNRVCWDHVHSDLDASWTDEQKKTCAVLDCSNDKATVSLYTPTALPLAHIDHRTLDAAGLPHSGSACYNPANNQPVDLDALTVATGGVQTIPDHGIENQQGSVAVDLNEDYANMLEAQQPAFDLNADYAQMWAAMSGRRAANRQVKGYKFSVNQGECQSGQSEGGNCPKRHPVSQHTLEIKEYFPVPGTPVELLTITHLVVSCDLCIEVICTSEPKELCGFKPVIKYDTTAQCQQTEYSCLATIGASGKLINVNIAPVGQSPAYHAADSLVGWQLAQLIYGIDPIITPYHSITAVGTAIGTTLAPKYHVTTDNVVEENKDLLRVRCEVDYCVNNDAATPRPNTCSTPRCQAKW